MFIGQGICVVSGYNLLKETSLDVKVKSSIFVNSPENNLFVPLEAFTATSDPAATRL